jgi:cobalamin biosynthesis protein CbiG
VSPQIAPHVVADFDLICTIDILHGEAAVADQLAIRFEDHGPESVAVVRIAAEIPGDPILDHCPVIGSRVEAHGLGIGEHCAR